MVDIAGVPSFGLSSAALILLVLLFSVTAVSLVIAIVEFRARRGRENRMPWHGRPRPEQISDSQPSPSTVVLAVANQSSVGVTATQNMLKPGLYQEASLQEAARSSGIDITILRTWAEQQRFKAASEEMKRAILRKLIDLEETQEKRRTGREGN